MRKLMIASHEKMAEGMKRTLDFITNNSFHITAISAYTSEVSLESMIASAFAELSEEDEVVILTDMMSGSVNQALIPYRKDHVFLITGFNLPLALEILLYPEKEVLNEQVLCQMAERARQQLQVVMEKTADMEDDE